MEDLVQPTSRGELPRREVMETPDEVAAMLRLKALGWGVRRIAGELGCSHMTVRRYLAAGGWVAYRGRGRPRALTGLEEWVAERFRRHAGNADVVRQELEREKGIRLALRTVEREVRHLRRELEAEARATIRFETPPGKQLQIDFGERRAMIGDENVKVYLFVASTLKLYGMRAAYDEVMTTGIKRRHEPPRIVGDLLSAEIAEKQARSIQISADHRQAAAGQGHGRLRLYRHAGQPGADPRSGDRRFSGRTAQCRAGRRHRHGKSHLAIAIARACIRGSARGRFYTVVDLVNRLESEARVRRQGRLAEYLTRMGLHHSRRTRLPAIRSDRRPAAVSPDQPAVRAHLRHHHYQFGLWRLAQCVWRADDFMMPLFLDASCFGPAA
jgi:transposase